MERRYNRELKKRKRKTFIRRLVLLALALFLIFLFVIYPLFNIKIRSFEVKDKKLPSSFNNYKILQISDLYLKGKTSLSTIEDAISEADPDLVVFTGNAFAEEDPTYFSNLVDLKNSISESMIFYVSKGQSELELDEEYAAKLFEKLKEEGIYLLDNRQVNLNKGGESIVVTGVTPELKQYNQGDYKADLSDSLKVDQKDFNLILCHNPSYADSFSQKGADLILSGARSGGWIRLPFVGGINFGSQSKYKEDDYLIDDKSLLIVSRGAGTKEGKFRLFNQREITEIILKR